jgi:hypothetical protein
MRNGPDDDHPSPDSYSITYGDTDREYADNHAHGFGYSVTYYEFAKPNSDNPLSYPDIDPL